MNDYIQEAKNRKQKYDRAYDEFNAKVKKRHDAIYEKYGELCSFGVLDLCQYLGHKSRIFFM